MGHQNIFVKGWITNSANEWESDFVTVMTTKNNKNLEKNKIRQIKK